MRRALLLVALLPLIGSFVYAQFSHGTFGGNGSGAGGWGGSRAGGSSPPPPIANPIDPSYAPTLTSNIPSNVWTASDLYTKVFRDTGSPGSNKTIKLSGPVNGLVAGQIFIQAGAAGIQGLIVDMTNWVNTANGFTLSTQTATTPGWARLYVSSYVFTATPTANASLGYYGAFSNFVPDQIIPKREPYYNQLTSVNSINIGPNNNQGFFIEGIVPTGTPSGFYTATVTLSTGGTNIGTIAAALEVFASTLSATAVFPSQNGTGYGDLCTDQWGSNSTCNRYGNLGNNSDTTAMQVMHDEMVFALDHRQSVSFNPGGWTTGNMQQWWGMLENGTTSSIMINPMLTGATLTTFTPNNAVGFTNNTTAAGWMTSMSGATPAQNTKLKPVNYACDEPSGAGWNTCRTSMEDIVASGMPNLITTTITTALAQGTTGLLNIPVRLVQNATTDIGAVQDSFVANQTNVTLGMYADCVSSADNNGTGSCIGQHGGSAVGACAVAGSCGWPNPHIDGLPVNNMALWPVMYISSSTLNLNSTNTQCWTTACGSLGAPDPWATGGMLYDGQGDETWWYPGTTAAIGVSTPTVVGSMRYDLMTLGEQYREYMKILGDNGQGNYAAAQLYTWVKNEGAMNENPYAGATYNGVVYSQGVVQAQQNLLCKIQSLSYAGAACAW